MIEITKGKISAPDLTIREIAYELGFEHCSSFNKLFKIKTQMLPLEFRRSFNWQKILIYTDRPKIKMILNAFRYTVLSFPSSNFWKPILICDFSKPFSRPPVPMLIFLDQLIQPIFKTTYQNELEVRRSSSQLHGKLHW